MTQFIAMIAVPELTLGSPKTFGTTLRVSAFAFTGVGAYLAYVGYLQAP